MKYTTKSTNFEELEESTETPFLEDLKKDLEEIDKHYLTKVAREIKKKMIIEITKTI